MLVIGLEKEKEKGKGGQSSGLGSIPAHRGVGGGGKRPRWLWAGRSRVAWWRQPVRRWAGAPGPWPRAGLGRAARERDGGAVHGLLRLMAGPVVCWLGLAEPGPLSPPFSSVHGAPGAAR